jgi:hypothetical protein
MLPAAVTCGIPAFACHHPRAAVATADALSTYKELRLGDLNVCYNDQLPRLQEAPAPAGGFDDDLSSPFCCGGVAPYKVRPPGVGGLQAGAAVSPS